MLHFSPLTTSKTGLASALATALENQPIRRAYLGNMALHNDTVTSPCLFIEWTDSFFPETLAQSLSNIACPFFSEDEVFNIAPVPPGEHWATIAATGERVIEKLAQ